MSTAQELRERKEQLGSRASYRRLGALVGLSSTTVYNALNEKTTGVPFDEEKTLRDLDKALTELEADEPEPVS